MDNRIILGSIDEPLQFVLVNDNDHLTPVLNANPTVYISKNAATFALPTGTVVEVGNGWYEVQANAIDVGTLGPLILHAYATGCDPVDLLYEVLPDAGSEFITQFTPAYPLVFLLVRSTDHVTGAIDLSPSVLLCPFGGTWTAPSGGTGGGGYGWFPFTNNWEFWALGESESPIFEVGYGWYGIRPQGILASVAGPLLLHASATGTDKSDTRFDVAEQIEPSTSLLGAIKAHFLADPTLDVITGGIFTTIAPSAVVPPYCVVMETHSSLALKTSTSQHDDHRVTFRVYATALDVAGQYCDLVHDSFKSTPLYFTGGAATPLVRVGGTHGIGGYGSSVTRQTGTYAYPMSRDGNRSFYLDVMFQTRVKLST